jgi:signal transduction histidine kinase
MLGAMVHPRPATQPQRDRDNLTALDRLTLDLLTRAGAAADDEVDAVVDEALRNLVAALDIERSAILRFTPGSDDLKIAHVWVEGQAPAAPAILRLAQFPWAFGAVREGREVVVPSLDFLPPEAIIDKRTAEAMGLRANVSIPVVLAGDVVGCLTCGSYSGERDWSGDTLAGLRRLAPVIATILARKIHQEALDRVVGFERLASSVLASILIAGPGAEDAAIISGLHGIAGFLGVDRATLWQWGDADGLFQVSHRWLSEAAGDPPQAVDEARIPWTSARLKAGQTVAIARASDLPPEAATDLPALGAFGLTALLAVPMGRPGAVTGAFVLSNTRQERGWPRNVIDGARLLAEVFSSLIARRLGAERERAAERRAEQDREALGYMARVDILGKLSASIAHQLNQPLAAILANAEAAQTMLRRDGPDLEELREICGDIIAEDHRAAEVIRRLGALYRRGVVTPMPLDLDRVIGETLDLLRSELVTREITVFADLAAAPALVDADAVQLQQVLLNLIVNAADAMSHLPAAERRLSVRSNCRAGEVIVSVSDRGSGIPPADLDTIFDAFWTTKAKGLGIGLTICRSIVAAHNGRLTVANADGGGACFSLALPARTGR